MKKSRMLLGVRIVVFLAFGIIYVSAYASIASDVKKIVKSKDDLALRIYLKKLSHKDLSPEIQNAIRTTIYSRPNMGYDLLQMWERFTVGDLLQKPSIDEETINQWARQGHEYFEKQDYGRAFENYQNAAQRIKKIYGREIPKYQEHFYYIMIHQMARSLYSLNKFSDATDVYQWIPRSYYHFRQVLFEKMWAAFRASRIDIALGAMASQQSAYFSRYLEPEAYLLRIYLLKRLCREQEVKKTIDEVTHFLTLVNENKYPLHEWVNGDLDLIVLEKLLEASEADADQVKFITTAERKDEKAKIRNILTQRFEIEKERLKSSLKKVLGYSKILTIGSAKELSPMKSLPDSKVLSANGKELWMSNDGEEWSDELGSHYYIGESRCKK